MIIEFPTNRITHRRRREADAVPPELCVNCSELAFGKVVHLESYSSSPVCSECFFRIANRPARGQPTRKRGTGEVSGAKPAHEFDHSNWRPERQPKLSSKSRSKPGLPALVESP